MRSLRTNPVRRALVGSVALLSLAGGAAGVAALTGTASAANDASTDTTVVADSGTTDTSTDATDATTDTGDTQLAPPTGERGGPRGDHAGAPSGPHSANGITEEELTGDTAASVEAAVTAAYPDATIDRMETDAEGAAYEAHITQADGSDATVKLDASFTITETVQGHG